MKIAKLRRVAVLQRDCIGMSGGFPVSLGRAEKVLGLVGKEIFISQK